MGYSKEYFERASDGAPVVLGREQHIGMRSVQNLEIIINIDFYGLAEKLSFHQLVAQLIPDSFSSDYDIDVVIRSSDEIYGILKKSANEREVTLKLTGWK